MPQPLQTMPCRVRGYEAAFEGLNLSETYLIAFNDICNGGKNAFSPAAYADYVGSYIYIPVVSKLFGSSIEVSTIFFFLIYGLFCILLSLIGLYRLYKSKFAKIYGSFAIISVGFLCIFISDTYSFYGLTSLALVTWWSKFYKLENNKLKNIFILCLLTGIMVAFSNSVRGHSGNDLLVSIFFVSIFLLYNKNINTRMIILFIILLPILAFNLYLKNLQDTAKTYLIKNTNAKERYDLNYVRAVWHNAYYSLGYLQLPDTEKIMPTDEFAVRKAQEINPNVKLFSKEYENVLKNEYIKFVQNYPLSFIKIILAKLAVLLFYFVIFFNIGIYFLFKNKFNIENFIFFLSGIIFNGLLGVATEPNYTYLLGLFAYSSLYSVSLIEDKNTESFKTS